MKENEKNNPGSLILEKDPILMSLMGFFFFFFFEKPSI